MKKSTIRFILSEITKEMEIADIDRQLYLLERKNINLKRLEVMEAKDIYDTMRVITEPIHAYSDQMVAIAKWIEAEFDYNPLKKIDVYEKSSPNAKLINAAPELLGACKDAKRMYEAVQPVGGWQGVYESLTSVIKTAE